MSWHANCDKLSNYETRIVELKHGKCLTASALPNYTSKIMVSNMSIKEFRRSVKKGKVVELYHAYVKLIQPKKEEEIGRTPQEQRRQRGLYCFFGTPIKQ